ncbi:MAG: ATP synthase F1 subunit gamma [Bacteroidales bacterium]|nr:ATP synthase F1 subunit gamma [Bacteroidales bacterium]
MANLKEVRVRIASVKSTRQITSAMKMVAASKLRRAQNAILGMRPYAQKLHEIMQNLSSGLEGSDEGVFAEDRGNDKVLLLPITSNRGLCGAFNANIIKETISYIHTKLQVQQKAGNVDLYCIGKKGADIFKSRGYNIVEINTAIFDDLTFDNSVRIAEELMQVFAEKKYDQIVLIYNQFKNAAVQMLQVEQLLPVSKSVADENAVVEPKANYIFEPNKEEILEALVPKSIKVQLYKALADSLAAEHGARMTAMHQATENADTLLKDLNLTYNKARQAAITNEILEIVSGAEALKG